MTVLVDFSKVPLFHPIFFDCFLCGCFVTFVWIILIVLYIYRYLFCVSLRMVRHEYSFKWCFVIELSFIRPIQYIRSKEKKICNHNTPTRVIIITSCWILETIIVGMLSLKGIVVSRKKNTYRGYSNINKNKIMKIVGRKKTQKHKKYQGKKQKESTKNIFFAYRLCPLFSRWLTKNAHLCLFMEVNSYIPVALHNTKQPHTRTKFKKN